MRRRGLQSRRWRLERSLLLLVSCGGPSVSSPEVLPTPGVAGGSATVPSLPAELRLARALMERGIGEATVAARLLASPDPVRRRTGRILAAFAEPTEMIRAVAGRPREDATATNEAGFGTVSGAPPSVTVTRSPDDRSTTLVPPNLRPHSATRSSGTEGRASMEVPSGTEGRASMEVPSGTEGRASTEVQSGTEVPSKDVPSAAPDAEAERRETPTLRGLAMRPTKSGATLELRADRGIVVGVAHDPSVGLVRLILDGGVARGAMAARPRVAGARVVEMRRSGPTTFVTVALDPGWRLVGTRKTRRGGEVHFERPR